MTTTVIKIFIQWCEFAAYIYQYIHCYCKCACLSVLSKFIFSLRRHFWLHTQSLELIKFLTSSPVTFLMTWITQNRLARSWIQGEVRKTLKTRDGEKNPNIWYRDAEKSADNTCVIRIWDLIQVSILMIVVFLVQFFFLF